MGYPNSFYAKSNRILEKRREKAAFEAEMRSNEIKAKIPEVENIQVELSKVGFELSKLFLYKGNTPQKVAELRERSESLVKKRGELLVKNGYKADSLSQEHVCPVCEDRGFINGHMCTCQIQLLKDIMRDEIKAVAPIDKCTFDNFKLDFYSNEPNKDSIVPRNKAKVNFDACRKYAANFSLNSKNLLFIGATGLGKTHLSMAILNVAINRGSYVCYGSSQNICDDLQAENFGRGDDCTYTKKQVLKCDLLVIDDLGTEVTNNYSKATIYNIINSRILSNKPTIINTNYTPKELKNIYDQRISSRLAGEYISMYFFGSDNRAYN